MIEGEPKKSYLIVRNDEYIYHLHWFFGAREDEEGCWHNQKYKGKIIWRISSLIYANECKYGHGYLSPKANHKANEG